MTEDSGGRWWLAPTVVAALIAAIGGVAVAYINRDTTQSPISVSTTGQTVTSAPAASTTSRPAQTTTTIKAGPAISINVKNPPPRVGLFYDVPIKVTDFRAGLVVWLITNSHGSADFYPQGPC